jgi:hypothetical protein
MTGYPMGDFHFFVFLPIVWAIVGSALGLLLYKYGKAAVNRNGVRLGGASAIGVVAFYGMMVATQHFIDPTTNMSLVPVGDMRRIYNLAVDVDRISLELQGCSSTLDSEACSEKVQILKAKTGELAALVKTATESFDKGTDSTKPKR